MAEPPKTRFQKVKKFFEKLLFVILIIVHVVSIAYLIFNIIEGLGVLGVNIALLALTSSYFLFYIFVTVRHAERKLKFWGKAIFKICKLIIKFFPIVIAVYGYFIATKFVNPFSVLWTVILAIIWGIQVQFDIILLIINKSIDSIAEAVAANKRAQQTRTVTKKSSMDKGAEIVTVCGLKEKPKKIGIRKKSHSNTQKNIEKRRDTSLQSTIYFLDKEEKSALRKKKKPPKQRKTKV